MAFRPLRSRRYSRYISSGFLPFEAFEFSGIRYSEAPYLRRMIRDRLRIKQSFDNQADANNWSKTKREQEYKELIRFEYVDNRWIREKQEWRIGRTHYKASPWEMLKDYRQRAIDTGEYHPVKGKRIRRIGDKIVIHIYKGDVEGQKQRARAKLRASVGTPSYARYQEQRRRQKERARQRRLAKEH